MPNRPTDQQSASKSKSGRRIVSSKGSLRIGPIDDSWFREHAESQVVARVDFRIDFCSATAMGEDRDENQDALLCRPDLALFAVADGMGGHAAGDVAARLSLESTLRLLKTKKASRLIRKYETDPKLDNRRAVVGLLREAIDEANDAVLKASSEDEALRGMGTTLDLILLVRDRAFVAHVGDARAYLVRPKAHVQLTHDHTAYDSLRTSGKRAPNRRWVRSPLNSSIGNSPRVTVDTLFVDLSSGDRVILCTDGAYGPVDSERAFFRLCETGSPREICGGIIAAAREQGGRDDATVIVLNIGERFVAHHADPGPRALDIEVISASPLLTGLPPSAVLSTLAAGVEVEIEEGDEIPRAVANDRVAYLVLDGLIELPNGRNLGASGLLMPESLLDVAGRGALPTVVSRARLLRIRHDDFTEVCNHDRRLAAKLYKRLAKHLATVGPSAR